MTLRGLVFLALLTALSLACTFYVTGRSLEAAGQLRRTDGTERRGLRAGIALGLFAASLLPLLSRFGLTRDQAWSEVLSATGFFVVLALLLSTAILLAIDAPRWLGGWLARRLPAAAAPSDASLVPAPFAEATEALAAPATGRRAFVVRSLHGAAGLVGAGHAGYAMTLGRHDYVLEERVIRIANLPSALEGLTIAQISDVHVGTFVRERELAAGLDLLRRARPDLVAMTGDLIDYDPRYVPSLGRFAREISGLRPRFGVFAVPGNHDYYTDVDAVLAALRGADVTVLRNDARAIEGRLALLGTDDCWAERDNWGARYDLGAALAAAPRDLPRILLCHNPERFAEAAPHVDLQISGHTHGGQVQLVVRPADIFLRHGFVEGHYELGASQLYVNRGFGTAGPPARLYTPPEVTKLVLVRA
jgi:predicted MPP superfamily phosphohydrolase